MAYATKLRRDTTIYIRSLPVFFLRTALCPFVHLLWLPIHQANASIHRTHAIHADLLGTS